MINVEIASFFNNSSIINLKHAQGACSSITLLSQTNLLTRELSRVAYCEKLNKAKWTITTSSKKRQHQAQIQIL